ncbi:hypothetical protein [Streptomyces sp. Inha503]|uniref:hypothetical protein n=1 Tax=Streptomyces sp. Inha503 TaxID=3383314 RepID=UPI00399EFD00
MYLAEKCDHTVDFLGMFSNPVGELVKTVAQLAMRSALNIFEGIAGVHPRSHDKTSSNVISGEIRWLIVYLSVGSLLFAAAKMALDRKADAGRTALKGMVRVIVVSAAASSVISTFAVLMDDYADHLLGEALDKLMSGIDCSGNIGNMLLLIIACLLILSGIAHTILLYIRLGVMILLMGTLPLAAAASMTDWGGTWWRKHVGWMVAWLLYKPTVALVLYAGAVMIDEAGGDQVDIQIAGMGLLLLSAIALPALMRVVVPATAALGNDSSGKSGDGAMGALASGASSMGGQLAMTAAMMGGGVGGAAAGGKKAQGAKNSEGSSSADESSGSGGESSGGSGGGSSGGSGGGSSGGSGGGSSGGSGGGSSGGSGGGSGNGSGGGGDEEEHQESGKGGGGALKGMAGPMAVSAGIMAVTTAATVAAQVASQKVQDGENTAKSAVEGADGEKGLGDPSGSRGDPNS